MSGKTMCTIQNYGEMLLSLHFALSAAGGSFGADKLDDMSATDFLKMLGQNSIRFIPAGFIPAVPKEEKVEEVGEMEEDLFAEHPAEKQLRVVDLKAEVRVVENYFKIVMQFGDQQDLMKIRCTKIEVNCNTKEFILS